AVGGLRPARWQRVCWGCSSRSAARRTALDSTAAGSGVVATLGRTRGLDMASLLSNERITASHFRCNPAGAPPLRSLVLVRDAADLVAAHVLAEGPLALGAVAHFVVERRIEQVALVFDTDVVHRGDRARVAQGRTAAIRRVWSGVQPLFVGRSVGSGGVGLGHCSLLFAPMLDAWALRARKGHRYDFGHAERPPRRRTRQPVLVLVAYAASRDRAVRG